MTNLAPEAATLKQRVEAVFSETTEKEIVRDYLNLLRSKLERIIDAASQSLTRALVLMAAFELLVRGAIHKATLGPFELQDIRLIRIALPVLVAYYFYRIMFLSYDGTATSIFYEEVSRITQRQYHENELDVATIYTGAPFIGSAPFYSIGETNKKSIKIVDSARAALVNLIPFSLVIWEVYAYQIQFDKFGLTSPATWVAMAISLALITYGACFALISPRE
jgi:hypothetical protein